MKNKIIEKIKQFEVRRSLLQMSLYILAILLLSVWSAIPEWWGGCVVFLLGIITLEAHIQLSVKNSNLDLLDKIFDSLESFVVSISAKINSEGDSDETV